MAHHALKSGYERLEKRLNEFPQGTVPSDLLYKILKMLFSEHEAERVSVLPIRPFTAEQAASCWKTNASAAQTMLDALADRAILLDYPGEDGQTRYMLPPPMAGFFEFSMMRLRTDVDQKLLAELFYQYVTVEEDFIKALFTDGETQLGRTLVQEPMIPEEHSLHVLDYERATEIIKTATCIGVGMCYCRHKMQHLGRVCSAPMDICMTFNTCAGSLTRHGVAREVSVEECLDLLAQAYEHNLVQFGDNVQRNMSFICNCCGCCCEAMIAARRFGLLHPVHTTNFLPSVDAENCTGCAKCVAACPVEAMTLVSSNDPCGKLQQHPKLNESLCLGCGVCARACTKDVLRLKPRAKRVITPVDSVHRAVTMAVERGKLQNLIFDNQVALSHRALAAVLGAILRLPPLHRAMAKKQFGSRYLDALIERAKF